MTSLPYSYARDNDLVVVDTKCHFTAQTPLFALAEAQRITGQALEFRTASAAHLADLIEDTYRDSASAAAGAAEQASEPSATDLASLADTAASVDDLLDQREDAPVVRLINAILLEAIRARASDVHIEVEEAHLVVR
ncbi:MAG: type II secretion system protein GspE, partial [Pseudomonadota bacterium]